MTAPRDPVAAVTHPDPYPYYAELVARRPLYRDEGLGLWVASSAAAVTAVLTSDALRVRPPAEPVPRGLVGSAAGDVFGRLVRMTDGPGQAAFKSVVVAALDAVDGNDAAARARRWARTLAGDTKPAADPARVTEFAFALVAHAVADLLGVPSAKLRETAQWTASFVACLAPSAGTEQIERGAVAAAHLRAVLVDLLEHPSPTGAGGLLARLSREAGRAGGHARDVVVANALGFLSQSYEATAALIGNTLLALASQRDVREQVAARPDVLADVAREVARHDAPVQNTRRFAAVSTRVGDQELTAGDAVLVVLAAANRDPAANAHPERFDVTRPDRRSFTFGLGAHACAGERLATIIAAAGVERLLQDGLSLERLAEGLAYRPSANVRLPLFSTR